MTCHDVLTDLLDRHCPTVAVCRRSTRDSMQTDEQFDNMQWSWKDDSGGVDLMMTEKFGLTS